MNIVTISGLDGSGKSTQVKLLQNYLHSQDKKVFYFHAIEFGLANKIAGKAKGKTSGRSVTKANFFTILLRRVLLWIDIWRFKDLLRKIRLSEFDYILTDRYFFDSVLNINYLSGKDESLWAEKMIPRPDLAIYLKVDPKTIMERERKPDQGLRYLEAKTKLFESKITPWNLKVVDGSHDMDTVFFDIIRLINKI